MRIITMKTGNFISDNDVQLMLKFKQGDDSAFEALLDKYQSPIINFIYRFIGDKTEAQDLAQEVFLRVWRSRQTYIPKAKFSTWIYIIARNLALNEIRRKKSAQASSLDETISGAEDELPKQVADSSATPILELEKEDLSRAVKKAIDSLPANQKTAVILRRYENLSYEEIAKIVGCSVSAVKSLLNRAKVTLKAQLSGIISVYNSEASCRRG